MKHRIYCRSGISHARKLNRIELKWSLRKTNGRGRIGHHRRGWPVLFSQIRIELSLKEKTILDTLYPTSNFSKSDNNMSKISKDVDKTWFHFKDVIVATILFLLINLPFSERLLEKVVKTDNIYYKLAYKSVTFAVLFFIVNNFYLSRR